MTDIDNIYIFERKLLYKELKPLFEALSSKQYAVVKGEVLSQQIYGAPDLRRSSDIDILIDKKNVKLLEEQLQIIGFEQKLPKDSGEARRNRVLCMVYSHQIPSYHKKKLGFHFNVDVNYDIFWGEYEGQRCSIEDFLCDTVDMEIYGVKVKTLPIDKAFVQLVLHHYKEMNSLYHLSQHNPIRIGMFRDVYDMMINYRDILTVEVVKRLCDMYLIGDYVYYLINYIYEVFQNSDFQIYLSELDNYRNEVLLKSYGLCEKERREWKIDFSRRLDNKNLCEEIVTDLNEEDFKKLNLNKLINF